MCLIMSYENNFGTPKYAPALLAQDEHKHQHKHKYDITNIQMQRPGTVKR